MPESPQFELVFSGRILPQFNREQVKVNLQRLFNANEAQLSRMFSGNPVVLKSRLSEEEAEKYKLALNRHGAECEVRFKSGSDAPESAVTTKAAGAGTAPADGNATPGVAESKSDNDARPEDDHSIIDDILAGINWDLAPVGSRMGPTHKTAPADILHTVSFDLAPPGSTIGEKKAEATPVIPDISHLSVQR